MFFHTLLSAEIREKVKSLFIKVTVPTPSNWDENTPGTMPKWPLSETQLEEIKLTMTLTEELKENQFLSFCF